MATKKTTKKDAKKPSSKKASNVVDMPPPRPSVLLRVNVLENGKPVIETSLGLGVVLNDTEDAIMSAALVRDILTALNLNVVCDFPRARKAEKK